MTSTPSSRTSAFNFGSAVFNITAMSRILLTRARIRVSLACRPGLIPQVPAQPADGRLGPRPSTSPPRRHLRQRRVPGGTWPIVSRSRQSCGGLPLPVHLWPRRTRPPSRASHVPSMCALIKILLPFIKFRHHGRLADISRLGVVELVGVRVLGGELAPIAGSFMCPGPSASAAAFQVKPCP